MAPSRSSFTLSFTTSCSTDTNKPEISIIAIPGYCAIPFDKWDVQEVQNAAASVNSVSRLFFYTYNQPYLPKGAFSWEEYLESAQDLLVSVARLVSENPSRPALIIAHSLGGTLLKRALRLAALWANESQYLQFLNCLRGIVLLATPHAGPSAGDTLNCHNQVLINCDRKADIQGSLAESDRVILADLASDFERVAEWPILSVYEADMHRKSKERGLFSRRSKPLVSEQLATIGSDRETKLGVDLGHQDVCDFSKLREVNSVGQWLRALFKDIGARKPLSLRNGPAGSPTTNPRDHLNPLDLANIEAHNNSSNHDTLHEAAGSSKIRAPTPLRSVYALHQLSNTSTERLLESKSCRIPCFDIPRNPNVEFVGRSETLELMDTKLLPKKEQQQSERNTTKFFALCGMGGIGKTDLAIQFAVSRQRHFDAVFWLDAASFSQLAADFARIATHLGLESPNETKDLETRIAITKAWLRRPWDAQRARHISWLLIFDNADKLDDVATYMPYDGEGSVLVTSRDPSAKKYFFPKGTGIDLQPLSTTESTTLLCTLTDWPSESQQSDEKDALSKLAGYSDGLPLAVTQMAAFVRTGDLSIREVVNLYASDAYYKAVRDIGDPTQQWRYGATLATTYNLKSLSTRAKGLLETISFLSPDRIREDIFTPTNDHDEADPSWASSEFVEARRELKASSIITRDTAHGEIRIHRIIQAEVRASMNDDVQNKCFKKAVSLLHGAWPTGNLRIQATKRWESCETLMPHLEIAQQLYVDHAEAWKSCEIDSRFPIMLNEAAGYLHERGFSQEGKPYLRLALDLCKKAGITTEPLISDMHITMGACSNETNDAQTCLEHNIISLGIIKAESPKAGKPDSRLAFAHNQMGIAYMMVRKFALATDHFKQSVELLKAIDADPDEFGWPMCNLGLARWIQGATDEAHKILEDLLKQREELHGKLDQVSHKTGDALHALGNVKASRAMQMERNGHKRFATSLWEESFLLQQDCLKQYESTLGRFNHRTADACHKLAEHYFRLKDYEKALAYLDRALSIWGDRPWFKNESARSSFLRGIVLKAMGGKDNITKGEEWIERAKMLRLEILSAEDTDAEKTRTGELSTKDFDKLVCFWSM